MNRIQKGLCIGTLVLSSLIGCEVTPPKLGNEYAQKENIEQSTQVDISLEKFQTLEGKITDVQPSQFAVSWNGGDSTAAADYEFLYVKLVDKQNKKHILIYPKSEFIDKGDATITFRSFPKGYVDVKTFRDMILGSNFAIPINFTINAEGLIRGIKENGIIYKQ